MRPFSESCEQNKHVILDIIKNIFSKKIEILEIGSGTGQHAIYFAENLPHITWQPSDREENIIGIQSWLQEYPGQNIKQPIILNVNKEWPVKKIGGIFSANTVHIMAWKEVTLMFSNIGRLLEKGDSFCLYGPFNYGGQYTSPSNRQFDSWLKQQNAQQGIRDIEKLIELANSSELMLKNDFEMPANNRIIEWVKE